ncbi:beta-1,3-galactosyltransferase 4-like [Hyalella azteca]|uniref:Hexosyltransferase n=1 Tax=Hyalella azteca TaxID=294128 RepID=A0A8B7P0S0_HYAAZ|nr:beta-1,3-galactosyltransferase 4-like [Hyalella azteca]XP_047740243.1 beta-1,3-galactosyltransferase 4-like [Hyalella azteca]
MERCKELFQSLVVALRSRWRSLARCAVAVVSLLLLLLLGMLSQDSGYLSSLADKRFLHQGNNGNSSILIDLTNFEYLQNPKICNGSAEDVMALVLILSHPSHINHRKALREQMPGEILAEIGMRRAFLLGDPNVSQEQDPPVNQSKIDAENNKFNDIVQGNFLDHFRNLTYKTVMGLTWATRFCSRAAFIIKMDDDIAVDFFHIRQLLQTRYANIKNVLLGQVIINAKPYRTSSKYQVTQEEYVGDEYPTYLRGGFYIAPMETVRKLVLNAHRFRYLGIEDVFVTGIMAQDLQIERRNIDTKNEPLSSRKKNPQDE